MPKQKNYFVHLLIVLAIFAALLSTIDFGSSSRARITANIVKSASNLRQIGEAIVQYRNDNAGVLPDSLDRLLENGSLTSAVLVSPGSDDVAAAGSTTQAAIAEFQMPGHCSYVYIAGRLPRGPVPADVVIAYERPDVFNRGSNVLFGDKHVEFENLSWISRLLAQLRSRSASTTEPTTMPSGT